MIAEVRCYCGQLLARNLEGRVEIRCHQCKRLNTVDTAVYLTKRRGWVTIRQPNTKAPAD